VMFNEDTEFL